MRSTIKGLISFLVVVFLGSTVISIVWGWVNDRPRKDVADLVPELQVEKSRKFKNTQFSYGLSDISGYNYGHLEANGKEPNYNTTKSYPVVDREFYLRNEVYSASFNILYSGLLNDSFDLDQTKLSDLRGYYQRVPVKAIRKLKHADENRAGSFSLAISDVRWLSPHVSESFSKQRMNYAEKSEQVEKAILSQFKITDQIDRTNPGFKNASFELGYVTRTAIKRQGAAAAKRTSLRQVSVNIFNAWRKFEKEHPLNRVRLLIRNSYQSDHEINDYSTKVKEEDLLILGENLADCIIVRSTIIRLNQTHGNPVKNLKARLGFALDTSNLIGVWQSQNNLDYKTKDKTPILQSKLLELLETSFVKTRKNQTTERQIHLIYASMNRAPEKLAINSKYNASTDSHLPYTRFEKPHYAINQLQFLEKVYEISNIGEENRGFIVLSIPRETLLPALHTTVRLAIAKLNKNYKKKFYLKQNGAQRWEQVYSLRVVRNYLARNSKE